MRYFGLLGRSNRFLAICAAGLDLAKTDPNKPPDQTDTDWYLADQSAWQAAR